ncbi:MAG: hypothetical protein HGA22_11560 [Clostridiales bacterium]|nr:hypothetical protein [Clostridiales bacterium]
MNYSTMICLFGLFILGVFVYGARKPKEILMGFLGLSLAMITAAAIQCIYLVFILYGTSVTVESLNQYSLQTFMISLIDRTLQITIIVVMLLQKQRFMKMNYFMVLTKHKKLAVLSSVVIVMNLVFVWLMCNLIYYQKILLPLDSLIQIGVVLAVIIFPVVNVAVVIGIINVYVNKFAYTKVYIQEESKVLRVLVQMLLKQQKYEDIDYELYSFEKEVKSLDL